MKTLSGDQISIELVTAENYLDNLPIEHFNHYGYGVVDFSHEEDQVHKVTDWAFVQWVLFMEQIDERG